MNAIKRKRPMAINGQGRHSFLDVRRLDMTIELLDGREARSIPERIKDCVRVASRILLESSRRKNENFRLARRLIGCLCPDCSISIRDTQFEIDSGLTCLRRNLSRRTTWNSGCERTRAGGHWWWVPARINSRPWRAASTG